MKIRTSSVIVAPLVASAVLLATALPASAAPTTVRRAGDNRYETAAKLSLETFGDGAETVYIASGENFPDALAGGAAAAQGRGPLLLTAGDELPEATAAELNRLTPTDVKVLGGRGVISDAVFTAIEDATGDAVVERISSNNRYTTAVETSKDAFEPGVPGVVIVSGETFADALAAGPVAASLDGPVLLVQKDTIPDTVAAEIDRLDPSEIVIVGGTGAVSAAVQGQLDGMTDGDVNRFAGSDRYATAALASSGSFTGPKNTIYLATGLSFADALAAAPVAGLEQTALLLTQPNCVRDDVKAEIDRLIAEDGQIVLLGGSGTLGVGVEALEDCDDL